MNHRQLAKMALHPVQFAILEALDERGEASPASLTRLLSADGALLYGYADGLGTVSYHAKVLAGRGYIIETRTRPVRGAVEHFYRLAADLRGES